MSGQDKMEAWMACHWLTFHWQNSGTKNLVMKHMFWLLDDSSQLLITTHKKVKERNSHMCVGF